MFLKIINNFVYITLMIDGIYSEVSLQEQIEHVAKRRHESEGLDNDLRNTRRQMESSQPKQYRRYDFQLDQNNAREIIGAPSLPSHLPEAEPILPGHTLIRPALGMLKSSIKFPHRELDNGAGVLGNYNNLGLKYDGRNERVLYTGFRRNMPNTRRFSTDSSPKYGRKMLADYILVVPSREKSDPRFSVTNLVLDLDEEQQASETVLKKLMSMRQPVENNNHLVMYVADSRGSPLYLNDFSKESDRDTFGNSAEWIAAVLLNARREIEDVENDDIGDDDDDDDDDDNTEHLGPDEKQKKQHRMTKREQFYASKNLFTNIKIHQDMANFEDLVPDLKSNEDNKKRKKDRPWWFFNQVDWAPFTDTES